MTYVRLRPENFDRLTSDLFKRLSEDSKTVSGSAKTDIYKKDKKLVFEMELPGFSKEEINVSSKENRLTISAEKKNNSNEEIKFLRKERVEGKIERPFIIPDEYDLSATTAKFENGILTITINEIVQEEKEIEISVK